jgi:heptosyltransferase-3
VSAAPRCLFIKPKLIGDTLLLTPTLEAVRARHPHATIDLLIRRGCESILEGCTAFNHVYATAAPDTDRAKRTWRTQWSVVRALRANRYDWVFECSDTSRGRYGALASRGLRRVYNSQELETYGSTIERLFWPQVFSDSVRFEWRHHHAVEGSYFLARDFLDLPPQPPALDFLPAHFDAATARLRVPAGFALSPSRLVVHCGTRLASKAWPDAHWIELLGKLAPRFEQIFLSTGPSPAEQDLARNLAARWPAKVHCPEGPLPWGQLAALLQGARLFVGVDTAAMHLAVACKCPAVVIWGPASAVVFGPLSSDARIVAGDRIVAPPYGPEVAHDEARTADKSMPATVLAAAELVLSRRA